MDASNHWRDLLTSCYRDTRFIVTLDVLGPALFMADQLGELGVQEVCALSAVRGAITNPTGLAATTTPYLVLEEQEGVDLSPCPPGDMMHGIRANMALFQRLPASASDFVDRFDPRGDARVIGPIFDDGASVQGRSKFGARHESWQKLEDKVVIDALWDEIGVKRAPSVNVPLCVDALTEAHASFARNGEGSVFALDNSHGFHGGASGTRWITQEAMIRAFVEEFAIPGHTSQWVRVMPFLDGIPCSIHGIVFPEHVLALRPCEMLIYRSRQQGRFLYAGSSNHWVAPEKDTSAMRDMVRRVGAFLREHHDYRGAFTIDGVLTPDQGFLPTELNPRFGAALFHFDSALEGIPLFYLHLVLVEQCAHAMDWRAQSLEQIMLQASDARPSGRLGLTLPQRPLVESRFSITQAEGGRWHLSMAGETPTFTLGFVHHPAGGYLSLSPPPGFELPPDTTFARHALEWLHIASDLYDLDLPEDLECV